MSQTSLAENSKTLTLTLLMPTSLGCWCNFVPDESSRELENLTLSMLMPTNLGCWCSSFPDESRRELENFNPFTAHANEFVGAISSQTSLAENSKTLTLSLPTNLGCWCSSFPDESRRELENLTLSLLMPTNLGCWCSSFPDESRRELEPENLILQGL